MSIYLYIRQSVGDGENWKEAFDLHLPARQAGGATIESQILCHLEHPHKLVILMGWNDLERAKKFVDSVSWQTMMRSMDVAEPPDVHFLEKVNGSPT